MAVQIHPDEKLGKKNLFINVNSAEATASGIRVKIGGRLGANYV